MMYNEVKSGDIPCLRFLKGTDYVMYLGPELTWLQKSKLISPDIRVQVIYLPDRKDNERCSLTLPSGLVGILHLYRNEIIQGLKSELIISNAKITMTSSSTFSL